MAYSGKFETITIQASEALTDLTAGTGEIYKAVGTTGAITGAPRSALGILQYGADDGGHVTLGYFGKMKFVAGGAVSAGRGVTVTTSGYFTQAGSGDVIVGRAIDTAVASGAVGTGLFNFVTPYTVTDSLGLFSGGDRCLVTYKVVAFGLTVT